MPTDMTISKVGERREWSGQHGPMVTYKIELEGHGPAELNQKPETIPPVVGQSVFGDLQPGREGFPPKLKKAQKQGGFNGGGGGKSPDQQKSIERQVAAKIAAEQIDFDPEKAKTWATQHRWLTDQIYAAIRGDE